MMYFLSDRGIFETHSHPRAAEALAEAQVTCRKNNNEMAKKTHNKTEG